MITINDNRRKYVDIPLSLAEPGDTFIIGNDIGAVYMVSEDGSIINLVNYCKVKLLPDTRINPIDVEITIDTDRVAIDDIITDEQKMGLSVLLSTTAVNYINKHDLLRNCILVKDIEEIKNV